MSTGNLSALSEVVLTAQRSYKTERIMINQGSLRRPEKGRNSSTTSRLSMLHAKPPLLLTRAPFYPMTFPEVTATTMAVYKHPLLALFTNVGSNGTASWNVHGTNWTPGTGLLEVFSCSRVTVGGTGGLMATSVGGQPQLYIPPSAPVSCCSS